MSDRFDAMLDGWRMEAVRVDERPDERGTWGGDPVHARVRVTAPNGAEWTGHYSAGGAHPIMAAHEAARAGGEEWAAWARRAAPGVWRIRPRAVLAIPVHKFGGRTMDEADAIEAMRRAWLPEMTDVVASLCWDATGEPSMMSFREWCEEYWHDDAGSPADAADTFEAVKAAERFVRRAFGDDTDDTLALASEL